MPTFDVAGFMTNYGESLFSHLNSRLSLENSEGANENTFIVGVVAFAVIYGFYKLRFRSKVVPYNEMDFYTGKAEIDEDEAFWLQKAEERGPLNWWQRIVDRFV